MGRHMMMRNIAITRWAFVAALCAAPLLAQGQTYKKISRSDLKTLQGSFADLADAAMPSVVTIRTYVGKRPLSQGSGAIFRSDGYIVTNYHVVQDAHRIAIILHNGLEYDATVMQVDERSDLAVIKIDADKLRAADFSDLKDVRVGHWTFAIGNPFGLSNFTGASSFSIGNVSSIGRSLTYDLAMEGADRYYGNLIETTAAINPGNSGGPLFNIEGKVIGIVAAIETRSGANEGVGFAIPMTSRTRRIVETLSRGEEVRYGFLGIILDSERSGRLHTVQGRRVAGVKVAEVKEGQPAHLAGLRYEDVIIELDGVPIEGSDHAIRVIGGVAPGDELRVRYVRRGRERTSTAVLLDREFARGGAHEYPPMMNWRGAQFEEMAVGQLRDRLAEGHVGIRVVSVRPASDAARRGLSVNQVVMSVNGERVRTLQQFRAAFAQAEDTIRLLMQDEKVIRFPQS